MKQYTCCDCSCCWTDKVLGICFECGDHAIPNCEWHGCPDLKEPEE